ncbi:TIGR01244 family sulfur transferase [Tsuneonella sp. HG222]
MSDFRPIDANFLASPQITLDDVAEAAAQGVTLVVNNRPEGESPDQTPGAEIERAVRSAGMDYIAIPVDHTGFSREQFEALAQAVDSADGKVLGYCRSGTRSTLLWALARASRGADPRELAEKAARAGYDLSPIAPALERLAAHDGD